MNDFTEGHIGKQILRFTLPMIGANLMMLSYQFINSVIIGTFLGKSALAAISATYPVLFGTIAIMIGLGSGAMVVVSQYFGAKRMDMVQKTTETINIIMLAMGICIGVLGYFCSEWIFSVMGLPGEAIGDATAYMQIYLGGILFSFAFYTFSSMLRGIGNSVMPMVLYACSAFLNIILDLILIAWLGYGIRAAAVATLSSQLAMFFIGVAYHNKKSATFCVKPFRLSRFDMDICRHCLRYGIPTGGQQFMVALGMIVLMGIVSRFGTDAVAGYGIGMRIGSIATLPAMNFASALAVFTGHNIGARNAERVRDGFRQTLFYSAAIAIIFTLIVTVSGPQIVALFTDDSNVIAIGTDFLRITSLFYIVHAVMSVTEGFTRGAGAAKATAYTTLLAMWIVSLPLAYLLSGYMETSGIWWAYSSNWAVGCIAIVAYYFSGRWKNRSVMDKNK